MEPRGVELLTLRRAKARILLLCMFIAVQNYLQISIFSLEEYRECSPLFVWVSALIGVLRVRDGGEALLRAVAS
jgi:hypothetical protein